MKSVTRLVGYSVLLLLVFLAAALAAQAWLHRQTQQLTAEAIAERRAQFTQAVSLIPQPPALWDEATLSQLSGLVGGTIRLHRGNVPEASDRGLYFDHAFGPDSSLWVRVSFSLPAGSRLISLHQRVVTGLALLALVLIGIAVLLALLTWRQPGIEGSAPPWKVARAEINGLAHFAKTAFVQGEALNRERHDRQRAEQDVAFKQRLLAQSLEEKISLGRDLHDGIIQSLYAVGLTLESVRALISTNPTEADRRLGPCLDHLNGTIR